MLKMLQELNNFDTNTQTLTVFFNEDRENVENRVTKSFISVYAGML